MQTVSMVTANTVNILNNDFNKENLDQFKTGNASDIRMREQAQALVPLGNQVLSASMIQRRIWSISWAVSCV